MTDIAVPIEASSAAAATGSVGDGPGHTARNHRGSWIPTLSMITTRFMELRKRRGLMIALLVVNIGLPAVFLIIRLLSHAFDPKSYGPAGGYSIFTNLVTGVMYLFGFVVAAVVGCTAGSADFTEGVFRHLVVTGRSRVALYLARIPAGLAIVIPIVLAGLAMVCAVCVFAAPTKINDTGLTVAPGLSLTQFEHWAEAHAEQVDCQFPARNITIPLPCGGPPPGAIVQQKGGFHVGPAPTLPKVTPSEIKFAAVLIAKQDYNQYRNIFLSPPTSLMVRTGLWLALEAAIGFLVGLGLSSLLGQRTIAVIMMIVLELILTPIALRAKIPYFLNVQRGVVGVATAHLEPAGLHVIFGGGGPQGATGATNIIPETRLVAALVIVGWIVVWSVVGAWRMASRDA